MNGILSMIAVLNSAGVSRAISASELPGAASRRPAWTAIAVIGLGLASAAILTGPILESLDITTPTFRLGAAVVIALTGIKWMLAPTPPAVAPHGRLVGHTVTLALTPGPVFAAMAATGADGVVWGLLGVALAVASLAVLLVRVPLAEPWSGALARALGAVAIIEGVVIGLDAARTV